MAHSSQTEQTAAEWLARRDGDGWSASDEAELEAWLTAATAHRVAYLRLSTAWQQADRLKALGAGLPGGTIPPPGTLEPRPYFNDQVSEVTTSVEPPALTSGYGSTRLRVSAIAAMLVAGIAAGWFYWLIDKDTYRTPVGAVTTVPIADGSTVTLNTDSEIRVAVTETERRVELRQGEAYFEVARDPNRPFIVHTGRQRVVALGTKFAVRRMERDLRVVVTEGKVRIEAAGAAPAAPVAELQAGAIARTADGGTLIQQKPLEEVETTLSWRRGYLVFRDTALSEAIAEFNRYNERKIVIEDPAIATIRIGGSFRSTNVEAFVRLLEQGFPIRAMHDDNQIVLISG